MDSSATLSLDGMLSAIGPHPTRDPDYFFEDGDYTFLVEDVLFKLPKFHLCRDPESMFCHMFHDATGQSAEPIRLDDTADDFRALCWAMFASPSTMYTISTRPGDVEVRKYLRVLDIAHKYLLSEYEKWAWTLARVIPTAIPQYLDVCSEDDLEHLIDLARRCSESAPELFDLVEFAWIARVRDDGLSYTRALTFGEERGMRAFQTEIYMELHRQINSATKISSPAAGFSQLGLTKTQLDRLLRGHALLSDPDQNPLAPRPNTLPPLPHCHVHQVCQSHWRQVEVDPSDAHSILVARHGIHGNYYCVDAELERMLSELKKAPIADYFLGPVASVSA
ncbi:hypothetical protein MKEN_00951900 [Mycena kentingensis (nom. inval.)]|nr:hypothetical protein MKEN_00951900 [Mycena kentingensis (nom. inval.)]